MPSAPPKLSSYRNVELAQSLVALRDQVLARWKSNLQGGDSESQRRAETIDSEASAGNDLFTMMLDLLRDDSHGFCERVAYWVAKVRGLEYSISDFHSDLSELVDAVEFTVTEAAAEPEMDGSCRSLIHRLTRPILEEVLKQTSEIYEHVVERGAAGFCQLDSAGSILYASPQLTQMLGGDNLEGKRLADYFGEDVGRRVVASVTNDEPLKLELRLVLPDGSERPVSADIQSTTIGTQRRATFAIFTDIAQILAAHDRIIAQFLAVQDRVLDTLSLAVIKIDRERNFTFANSEARRWLGEDLVGRNLRDVVAPDGWSQVETELARRERGKGGFYNARFIQADKQVVPVQIAGIPITDSQGEHAGSIGFIRNRQLPHVSRAIHNLISAPKSGVQMLNGVAEEVQKLVPFDHFYVIRYSSDQNHSMNLHDYVAEGPPLKLDVRWWKILELTRKAMHKSHFVDDFPAYMAKPEMEEYRQHPSIKRFMERRYQSYAYVPARRGGKTVGGVYLFSLERAKYSQVDVEKLEGLPLEKAVQMAFHYQDMREQEFRHKLLRKLLSCKRPVEVAATLVKQLVKNYQWKHAAIFRVDEAAEKFRLLAQHSDSRVRLKKDYSQALDEGVLGHVLDTGKSFNLPNTDEAKAMGITYRRLHKDIRSELCIPIAWDRDDRVRMLLNIESSNESAFSKDEVKLLEEIVESIKPVISRLSRQFVLESAFATSSDALLVTDALDTIREANQAALDLLEYKSPKQLQKPVKTLFSEEEDAERLLSTPAPPDRTTHLKTGRGKTLEATVDAADLPEDTGGGKFIKITDLAPLRHLQQLKAVREFYYEVATQTMTPLSLVKTWVARLHDRVEDDELQRLADNAGRQLSQAEIILKRIALYDEKGPRDIAPSPKRLNLLTEIGLLRKDFPRSEAERIVVDTPDIEPLIDADPAQVAFMFKTILAYVLRHLPYEDEVHIEVDERDGVVHAKISGSVPDEAATTKHEDYVDRVMFDLALGEQLIQAFAKNNGADYLGPQREGSALVFPFEFPGAAAAEEV